MVISALLGLLFMLFILAMFLGGIVLIVKSRRRGSDFPTCGSCGYDLTGSTAATDLCPECGGRFTIVGITPPQSGRRSGLLAVGIVLLLLPLTCGGLLTFAIAARSAAPQRVGPQAIIAQQQQVTVQTLQADLNQLSKEFESVRVRLKETTDEDERRELEAEMLKIEQDLYDLETQIKQLASELDDTEE